MDLRLNIYCLTCKNFENVNNVAKTEFKNIHIIQKIELGNTKYLENYLIETG